MKRIYDRVAGLDVHRDTVVACARVVADDKTVQVDKKTFKTTRTGLRLLANYLAEWEVTLVAMEATGVYWKPVYYALEDRFDQVWLCNAHHVKNVPGRKTDLSDAEWLADVAAHGMVRPSLVPPPQIRQLRDLTRYRKTQIEIRGKEIQRLEKVLQDAGIKLTSVASTVWSVSSRDMVERLIAGPADPHELAQLARGRLRDKIPALQEALDGQFARQHALVARRIVAHIDFLDHTIQELSDEIAELMRPFEVAITILETIPGVSRIGAEVIIAETGGDMSRFPTAGHLCAWAGVAPASYESAGRSKPAGTRKGGNWLRRQLIESARGAARTKDSYSNAQYRRIASRRGPNKANVAVAHSILATAWTLLRDGTTYTDPGSDYFDKRNDPARQARRLAARIEGLGYRVDLKPAS